MKWSMLQIWHQNQMLDFPAWEVMLATEFLWCSQNVVSAIFYYRSGKEDDTCILKQNNAKSWTAFVIFLLFTVKSNTKKWWKIYFRIDVLFINIWLSISMQPTKNKNTTLPPLPEKKKKNASKVRDNTKLGQKLSYFQALFPVWAKIDLSKDFKIGKCLYESIIE